MASVKTNEFRMGGIRIQEGRGTPTHVAPKGTLYIKLDASGTTDRLFMNTDGGVTWVYFTASA